MFVYLDTSEILWIIYRSDLHNLQIKTKIWLIVTNEVSVNVKTNCLQIWLPGFLLCLKCIIYRPLKHQKMLKNSLGLELNFLLMQECKNLQLVI